MIMEIKAKPGLIEQEPIFSTNEVDIYGENEELEGLPIINNYLNTFLRKTQPGDFVAINAFVNRNETCFSGLQKLRVEIANKTNLATTLGFGPRFLHSTGQLHKGGKNNGHYLIITAECENDLEIPGEGMNFGTLQIAQAIGDMRALQQQNRHVLRLNFKKGKFNPALLAGFII